MQAERSKHHSRSRRLALAAGAGLILAAGAAGCGSGSSGSGSNGGGGGAEAQSAATGDIPDNAVFLNFHNRPAGYAIKYPEGWTQRGRASDVSFSDKGNSIHVRVASAPPPSLASVSSELGRLRRSDPSVEPGKPVQATIGGSPVVRVTYSRRGAPDPVTGKRPTLVIDRYEYAKAGKLATLDLATPKGVDNVDAFRMISESFKWE